MIFSTPLKFVWTTLLLWVACLPVLSLDSTAMAEDKPEKVVLQLAWKHQFQFAGYYAALAKGYFRQAGLDVTIVEGGEGHFAREKLLNNHAQYGVAGAELLLHRLDGDPFVVLAPIFQHSPSILLARSDTGVSSLQDLTGKRVMLLPGKKDADILAAFLNEGVPLDSIFRIDQSYNLNDLIEGRTDAVSAYLTNEPWQLEQKGILPKIISPLTYGVDFYSDCLFTTDRETKEHPERVEKFLAASLRGWEYAISNIEEVIDIILKTYDPGADRSHLRYEAEAIKTIMLPDLIQIGHMNPGRWHHIGNTYKSLGMIRSDFSLEGFLYNPHPKPDHTRIRWILGVTLFISLLVGMSTIALLIFNRKLKTEVEERKRTEAILLENEKKYRHLFNNAPAGIYEIDFLKGRFINVNDIMCKYSGYSKEELLRLKPLSLLTDNSKTRFKKELKKLFADERISDNPEFNIRKKNGQKVCVVLNSDFIYEKGKLRGAIVVAHDISERKQAEEQKIKAQEIAGEQKKLALIGQIAGKMAHDFNNILGIIMGNTELLLMDYEHTPAKETLDLIFQQTLRGKNLTRNLVAFAKDQEPKHEFFRIKDKIDLVLSLMGKDLEGIQLTTDHETDLPELLADPGMIEHALVNLIQNSIHAVSRVDRPWITIRTFCHENHICLEVKDNGCGILEKHMAAIYEPSFTLKGNKDVTGAYKKNIKGTGYGMANVKKYTEQHKGYISCESKVGAGTKFTLHIPVIQKELTRQEKTDIQKNIIHFNKQILVVEDEAAISDVQKRVLSQDPCNHTVDIADTVEMAIDLFDRNTYDCVSLDYALPGELNGMTVYHHIRKTNPQIPILFISGNIEFLESIKALKQKDDHIDHQSKPCQNKAYVNSINRLIERTRSAQELGLHS